MRISSFSDFLIQTDKTAERIPLVSTVTNLVDIFLKYVVFPKMKSENINNNHYFTHLNNKKAIRCIILLIPVLGNIVVGIYDFIKKQEVDETKATQKVSQSQNLNNSKKVENNQFLNENNKSNENKNEKVDESEGVKESKRQAEIKLLQQNANLGDLQAIRKLAFYYAVGLDFKKDIDDAIAFLETLPICSEDVDSWFMLGNYYALKEDKEKAFDYYTRGVAKEHTGCMVKLANYHMKDIASGEAKTKAIDFYIRACSKGFDVREIKEKLSKLDLEVARVVEQYKDDAKNKDIEATIKLAFCNLYGLGVTISRETAYDLLMQPEIKENKDALLNLGHCTQIVPTRAIEFYDRAWKEGNSFALISKAKLIFKEDRDQTIALLQTAVLEDNDSAMMILADLTEDKDKVIELWQQAAAKGNSNAEQKLRENGIIK